MRTFAIALILVLAAGFVGCDKPAEQPQPEEPTTAPEPATPDEPVAEKPAEGATVEVAAAGTKFDPPVKPQQLPDGAYFCDMGTVHYAQTDPGEKCPVCGMALKQYKTADYAGHAEQPAGEPDHHHDDGEEHDDDHHADGHKH